MIDNSIRTHSLHVDAVVCVEAMLLAVRVATFLYSESLKQALYKFPHLAASLITGVKIQGVTGRYELIPSKVI